MKAKKVYEFRTSGEIVKMGKDFIFKKEVNKILNKIITCDPGETLETQYEIKYNANENSIIIRDLSNYKFVAFNRCTIPTIPFKIISEQSIEFYNYSKEHYIEEFNVNVESNNYVYFDFDNRLKKINGKLKADFFMVEDNTLTELSDGLELNKLYANDMKYPNLRKLPNNVKIHQNLLLDYNWNIEEIGDNLEVMGNLIIRDNAMLIKIGKNAVVHGYTLIHDSLITVNDLPEDFKSERIINSK
jgi:hypothetical protein